MITRVPMNISAGTRDARELLVSLLVESLNSTEVFSRVSCIHKPPIWQFNMHDKLVFIPIDSVYPHVRVRVIGDVITLNSTVLMIIIIDS